VRKDEAHRFSVDAHVRTRAAGAAATSPVATGAKA
jgi:hypothetical protein